MKTMTKKNVNASQNTVNTTDWFTFYFFCVWIIINLSICEEATFKKKIWTNECWRMRRPREWRRKKRLRRENNTLTFSIYNSISKIMEKNVNKKKGRETLHARYIDNISFRFFLLRFSMDPCATYVNSVALRIISSEL